jgi:hypothetical protein
LNTALIGADFVVISILPGTFLHEKLKWLNHIAGKQVNRKIVLL